MLLVYLIGFVLFSFLSIIGIIYMKHLEKSNYDEFCILFPKKSTQDSIIGAGPFLIVLTSNLVGIFWPITLCAILYEIFRK